MEVASEMYNNYYIDGTTKQPKYYHNICSKYGHSRFGPRMN